MLTIFPSLLVLKFYAPTILRVCAALYFVYIGRTLIRERKKIEEFPLPLVGHATDWMIWLSGLVTLAVAAGLLLGYYTQPAAIVGMLICIKHAAAPRRFDAMLPLPRSTYAVLFVICLSLLLTGAGAFAFDLPL